MSRIGQVGLSAIVLVTAGAALARADDITAKKLFIKDSSDPAKRQAQVQSKDPNVLFSKVDDPGMHGAAVHFYSATDDFCVILPSGPDWVNKNNKAWKYKNKTTKNGAQVKDGKLGIKIKSGVTYTLADDGTQGAVNAEVQFGIGTRFCMRCTGNKKNDASKFLGSDCTVAACDPEPSPCESEPNCTNTPTGVVVKGSLVSSLGRFNYDSHIGLTGAVNACSSSFAGSHPCTYQELQSAPTSDLACLKDTASSLVTSFWAIDPNAPALQQCNDDAFGGSGLNWEYATAHTASRGQKVTVDPNGVLGSLQSSVQCNIGGESWVACCQ